MPTNSTGDPDLTTTADIAKELNVHKTTINRIAAKHELGDMLGPMRVFSRKDAAKVKKLCKLKKGNPNFGKTTAPALTKPRGRCGLILVGDGTIGIIKLQNDLFK